MVAFDDGNRWDLRQFGASIPSYRAGATENYVDVTPLKYYLCRVFQVFNTLVKPSQLPIYPSRF